MTDALALAAELAPRGSKPFLSDSARYREARPQLPAEEIELRRRRMDGSSAMGEYPDLAAYVARGEARPAFKRAFEAQRARFTNRAAGNRCMSSRVLQAMLIAAVIATAGCSALRADPGTRNGETTETTMEQTPTPAPRVVASGFAPAAEGLKVHYQVFGQGEPIVVLAGGLMDISGMDQVIGPLSARRQVIGIDLEGHGRTALRDTPMSHQRNGDDVAAVLRHLKIARADIAGYSHGGDAAIRIALQHPEMVRNLIAISTAAAADGWYPDNMKAARSLGRANAEKMKPTSLYKRYAEVAPRPEQFEMLLDRMGELKRRDYDWRAELGRSTVPTLLVFADHDAVSTRHIAEFFALFGGGLRDVGLAETPQLSHARLAIVPGYTHYNFGKGPDIARIIEAYLTQPTSLAPPFTS
jgi:pimeloyl-ACP methyl ester carboxylesterase